MNWYTWPSEADFNTWHQTVIDGMGLPKVGFNAATGQLRPDAQMTTAYTSVVEVAVGDWRAPVGEDVSSVFVEGIGVVCDAPVFDDLGGL